MEEKMLNEKESLELITRMIQNTQNRLVGNEGMPFLIWGYVTVAVTIAVGIVMTIADNYLWNLLWLAIPVLGGILSMAFKKKVETGVRTYIDKIVEFVWLVLGISCLVSSVLCIFCNLYLHILFVELLLVGIGTAVTGLVINFKPVAVGGFVGVALSFVMLFVPANYSIFIFALSFVAMMIVPGHILNRAVHQQVNECI
jgi:hypothetical protein